jgi:ATP-dependent RNA helicase RhlE
LHQIQKLMKIEVPVASGSSPLPDMDAPGGRRNGSPRRRGSNPGAGKSAPAPTKSRRPRRRRAA